MEGIDKNTFKQIFHDYWDAFKQFRPHFDSPDHNETVDKMLGCGDPDSSRRLVGAKRLAAARRPQPQSDAPRRKH